MPWFSKNVKKPREEIEKIKKTITQETDLENEKSEKEIGEINRFSSSPVYNQEQSFAQPSQSQVAPLFVKLEKYDSIIKRIQVLDEILRNTIEVMKVNDEIERVKNEVIKTLLRNLQEAIKIINFLNRELIRPVPLEYESLPSFETRRPEIESLEEHVSELKKQLEELKKYF